MATIGIKIANGKYYPILPEKEAGGKRLVLTTVHDDQSSVQIDLYRSSKKTTPAAQYIGSLVVENIKPRKKGEPSIELLISSNGEGEITADAIDIDNKDRSQVQHLSISLHARNEADAALGVEDFQIEEESPRRAGSAAGPFVLVVIGLILAAIILLLISGVLPLKNVRQMLGLARTESPAPVLPPAPASQEREAAAQEGEAETESDASAPLPPAEPVLAETEAPPPAPPPVPAKETPPARPAAKSQTVAHKVRWGDTLWNLADQYYHNPWAYRRIATYNGIRNPNHIVSGTIIKIPK